MLVTGNKSDSVNLAEQVWDRNGDLQTDKFTDDRGIEFFVTIKGKKPEVTLTEQGKAHQCVTEAQLTRLQRIHVTLHSIACSLA